MKFKKKLLLSTIGLVASAGVIAPVANALINNQQNHETSNIELAATSKNTISSTRQKAVNLTTTVTGNQFQISEGQNVLPSDFANLMNDPMYLNAIIKTKQIQNTVSSLAASDIQLSNAANANNKTGTINVDLTIKNNKAQVDSSPLATMTFKQLTIAGLKSVGQTRPVENRLVNIVSGESKVEPLSYYSESKVKEIIAQNISQYFTGYPENIGASDIILHNYDPQPYRCLPETPIWVSLKRYYDNNGNLHNDNQMKPSFFRFSLNVIPEKNFTYINQTGFRTDQIPPPSIDIKDDIYKAMYPSDFVKNQQHFESIKELLADNTKNFFNVDGWPPFETNYGIEIVSVNDYDGSIEVKPTLNGGYYQENGTQVPSKVMPNVTFFGFKTLTQTIEVNKQVISIQSPNANIYANQFNISNIKALAKNNITRIILNANPSDFSEQDFDVIKLIPSMQEGTLFADVQLKKYYDELGNIQTGNKIVAHLRIHGFKNFNLTTTIKDSLVFNPTLAFKASEWSTNQKAIKQAIIVNSLVSNLSLGQTALIIDDITLDTPTEINDLEGTMKLKVTISAEKAWVMGEQKAVNKVVSFSGFKKEVPIVPPTPTTTTTAKKPNNSITTINTSVDAQNCQVKDIVDSINKSKQELWNDLPASLIKNDIKEADLELKDIVRDNAAGSLTLTVALKTYIQNGQEVTQSTPLASTSISLTITGFNTQLRTTSWKINNGDKIDINHIKQTSPEDKAPILGWSGFAGMVASNVTEQVFKDYVINVKWNMFYNPPNNLSSADVVVKSLQPNNEAGTLNVTFTINRGFNNSLVAGQMNLEERSVTLTGFLIDSLPPQPVPPINPDNGSLPQEPNDDDWGPIVSEEQGNDNKLALGLGLGLGLPIAIILIVLLIVAIRRRRRYSYWY